MSDPIAPAAPTWGRAGRQREDGPPANQWGREAGGLTSCAGRLVDVRKTVWSKIGDDAVAVIWTKRRAERIAVVKSTAISCDRGVHL